MIHTTNITEGNTLYFLFQIMLCETYLPSFQKCQRIQGQMDLLYAQKIRTYDIEFPDLGKHDLLF